MRVQLASSDARIISENILEASARPSAPTYITARWLLPVKKLGECVFHRPSQRLDLQNAIYAECNGKSLPIIQASSAAGQMYNPW